MRSYPSCSIEQNPTANCPQELFGQLIGVPVRFAAFSSGVRRRARGKGIIEIHRDLVADVMALFRFIQEEQFPLSSVMPIADFDWSDKRSTMANNTSGFNYRMIAGTKHLSKHAFGRAIDINPWLNPCIQDGVAQPAGAVYGPSRPGTLTADSPVTQFLKTRGWIWGGDWASSQDYQHFEKS